MKAAQEEAVHVFSVNGCDLAFDSATGSLHSLDPVGKAVLQYACRAGIDRRIRQDPAFEKRFLEEVKGALFPRFTREEVEAAWEEALPLIGKTLWGDDFTLQAAAEENSDGPEIGSLKALCLNVAHDCNLACEYCFAARGHFGGKPQLMPPSVAMSAMDFLVSQSGKRRYLDVDFFGGEPLMAFDTVKEAVGYARRLEKTTGKIFRFTLTTNCVLLDAEVDEFLNAEGISVILSIDGRPEVHDRMRKRSGGSPSHATVLRNALRLVQSRQGRDYYVRGTFTRHNLDFYEDVKYLYAQGFRRMSLEPVTGGRGEDWAITEQDLPALREAYSRLAAFWKETFEKGDPFSFYHFEIGLDGGVCKEKRITGCGAGYEYLAVTPDGSIYPCHQLVGKPEFNMGNVSDGIVTPALMRRFYEARVPYKPRCIKCWARYLCGGGCHAGALLSTGDIKEPDPLACLIMKTRLEFALYVQYIKGI